MALGHDSATDAEGTTGLPHSFATGIAHRTVDVQDAGQSHSGKTDLPCLPCPLVEMSG